MLARARLHFSVLGPRKKNETTLHSLVYLRTRKDSLHKEKSQGKGKEEEEDEKEERKRYIGRFKLDRIETDGLEDRQLEG